MLLLLAPAPLAERFASDVETALEVDGPLDDADDTFPPTPVELDELLVELLFVIALVLLLLEVVEDVDDELLLLVLLYSGSVA